MSLTNLTGKTILVTGASRGIGAAIRLVSEGARVIAHYRGDRAGAQAELAAAAPDQRHLLAADLSVPGQTANLSATACAWRGRVDVLVNNAAMMAFDGGVDDPQDVWAAAWNASCQTNVKSAADLLRGAVRHFREHRGGIVVTICRWNAQRGSTNPATMHDAGRQGRHHGCDHDRRGRSAKENILACIIAPGVVRIGPCETFAAGQGGEAAVTATLASGERVPPSDTATLVAFLSTGACRHPSGATLDGNGATHVR